MTQDELDAMLEIAQDLAESILAGWQRVYPHGRNTYFSKIAKRLVLVMKVMKDKGTSEVERFFLTIKTKQDNGIVIDIVFIRAEDWRLFIYDLDDLHDDQGYFARMAKSQNRYGVDTSSLSAHDTLMHMMRSFMASA